MNGFHGAEALGATPSGLEARLGELATSIVNIELTLRVEYGYGGSSSDDEATVEVRGSIVDPGGLILVSNLYLAPQRMRQLAGSFGEGGDEFRFDLKPTAIRIQVPGITEDQPAFLAASDTDLDLAFLQLEQVPQKSLPAVDFSKARPARVGEEVMVVSRLLENFDRAPFLFRGFVTGELKKPRRSWVVQLPPSGLGLPVFAVSDGVPLGVLATIFSPVENTRDAGGWLSGFVEGSGDPARGPIGLFLIPAERVQAAVELARQRARELLKERTGARAPSPAP
jgi:hypothetical protein